MIRLRNAVAVFLKNGDNFLVIKRADNRILNPGFWSGVGGHMEPCEINDPAMACYREIEEETGIKPENIESLELLYLIVRRNQNEIRHSYIFFGGTTQTEVVQTDEGVLHWVKRDELLDCQYTATFAKMLEHFSQRDPLDRRVYVGVAENENGGLHMNWSCCEDFNQI